MNTLLKTCNEKNASVFRVPIEVIRPLRHRLLRPGLAPESAHFSGDHRLNTWHIAVFRPASLGDNGTLVSCASFILEHYEEEEAWQLRGMCTDPLHQGCGFGALLLKAATEALVADSDIRLFWCNARAAAIPFYLKQGWSITSDEFNIPTVGQHRKMTCRV
jgi:GNAT superfamily N-acetyltransferase